jgi:hypothetical protein
MPVMEKDGKRLLTPDEHGLYPGPLEYRFNSEKNRMEVRSKKLDTEWQDCTWE